MRERRLRREGNEAQSGASGRRARRAALMLQELESVDFYINQGYDDIAADTLDLMQRQFGRESGDRCPATEVEGQNRNR